MLLALWLQFAAHADERAEYVRLAGEVQNLAQRNAWAGVERAYTAALRTGETGSFDLHMAGAQASWARGDARGTRERLARAHELREDRHVVEWMYRIDHAFGQASVQVDPGLELQRAGGGGFDPEATQAVAFAAAQILATGRFTGLLPRGAYTIGPHRLHVGDRPARLDVAPDPRSRRRTD